MKRLLFVFAALMPLFFLSVAIPQTPSEMVLKLEPQISGFSAFQQKVSDGTHPKPIALEKERPFEAVLNEWENYSYTEEYLHAIDQNIRNRLKYIESLNSSLAAEYIDQLKSIIADRSYVYESTLAVEALILIARIEKEHQKRGLADPDTLFCKSRIRVSSSLQEHAGKILEINSAIYNVGEKSWYKEGYPPGSGDAWITWITVKNTGTKESDFYVEMNEANQPSGWWLGFANWEHRSETFRVLAGDTYRLKGATQSPNYGQSYIYTCYDLYWDRNWPLADE